MTVVVMITTRWRISHGFVLIYNIFSRRSETTRGAHMVLTPKGLSYPNGIRFTLLVFLRKTVPRIDGLSYQRFGNDGLDVAFPVSLKNRLNKESICHRCGVGRHDSNVTLLWFPRNFHINCILLIHFRGTFSIDSSNTCFRAYITQHETWRISSKEQ